MFRKKPPPRPKDSAQDLRAALKEAAQAHAKQVKQDRRSRKRKGKGNWLADWPGRLKVAGITGAVVLAGLVFDGVRRENAELHAFLTELRGRVSVIPAGKTASSRAEKGMALSDRDVVETADTASATVTFPDGSAIEVEPATRFEVRTLDYVRSGRRDRSFMVHAGSVVARFSKFFGAGSMGTVCTPTTVAAVRGTGFRVIFDQQKRLTYIAVVEGKVVLRTASIESSATAGQLGVTAGYDGGQPQGLAQDATSRIGRQVRQMDRYATPPGLLQRIEFAINSFLDPFLQILGITPGTWGYNTASFARTATCMEALRKLNENLHAASEAPDRLNPITLEELQIDPKRRDAILDSFQGRMLDFYRKTPNGWVVQVHARDRDRTGYQLTESGPSPIKE